MIKKPKPSDKCVCGCRADNHDARGWHFCWTHGWCKSFEPAQAPAPTDLCRCGHRREEHFNILAYRGCMATMGCRCAVFRSRPKPKARKAKGNQHKPA